MESEGREGRLAYVGREPDGQGFNGHVTEVDGSVSEQGEWPTVEEALDWARARAGKVRLMYGYFDHAIFSAGEEAWPDLLAWPPEPDIRDAIDEEVAAVLLSASQSEEPTKITVAEPVIVRRESD